MSKICLCVLHGARDQNYEIASQIKPLLNKYSISLFWDIAYHEPIIDVTDSDNTIIFSIADDSIYDNCEHLLLPDECSVNGFVSPTPFGERMKSIQDLLQEMSRYCNSIELFVGDSGCRYDEYEKIEISISDFADTAKCMNSPSSPDMHFMFSSTGDGFMCYLR